MDRTDILNRICNDTILRDVPVVILCRTVALTLDAISEIMEGEKDVSDKSEQPTSTV